MQIELCTVIELCSVTSALCNQLSSALLPLQSAVADWHRMAGGQHQLPRWQMARMSSSSTRTTGYSSTSSLGWSAARSLERHARVGPVRAVLRLQHEGVPRRAPGRSVPPRLQPSLAGVPSGTAVRPSFHETTAITAALTSARPSGTRSISPRGTTCSTNATPASAAIHHTFITPRTSAISISAQQQPTQKVP